MRPLSLVLLAAVLLVHASNHGALAQTPKPSDTDNKPPTPAPAPTTVAPGATTPAPTTKPPTATTPAPTTAPTPTAAPTATTPAPTTEAPTSTAPPPVVPIEAPEVTPGSNDASTATNSESSGMGAGAIVGIIIACVGLLAVIVFFVYRHIRARREDAQHYGMDYDASSPPMTVLESSRANESKMYGMVEPPKYARRPTAPHGSGTPTDDIVIMTKYATPSSPKFSQNPPQLSPPPFQQEVADFTKSVNNYETNLPSTEFQSSYRESDTESYAGGASYGGGGSFMNSFDHGVSGFRDTVNNEDTATGEPNNNNANGAHWMEAMDEMRDTNDSYAMLEAGGSFNSRSSAMRFSTESDLRG